MLLTFFLFFLSAAIIYVSCELFVNGIEWCGRKLNFGATATGSVLAAFGTALPESAVTFTAVVFGATDKEKDIGVGAALGGPLVLATIAYAVVGLALLLKRRRQKVTNSLVKVDYKRLSRDQAAFLGIFIFKVSLGLLTFSFKPWLGVLFLLAYVVYVWREIKSTDTAPEEEELEPLKLRPRTEDPSLAWISLQLVISLGLIAMASHIFVNQLGHIGSAFGLAPHIVALLLSPVATELPETMNAIIWVRQGKERLALANISGAMMIQATIPSALGLFFTPWLFDGPLLVAGIVTGLAVAFLWTLFRRGNVDARILPTVGLLYGVFCGYVLWHFH